MNDETTGETLELSEDELDEEFESTGTSPSPPNITCWPLRRTTGVTTKPAPVTPTWPTAISSTACSTPKSR
jgi:hypothetical protein